MTGRQRRPLPAGRVDAGGTMWRLRSLLVMGHDCARIARALGVPPQAVQRLVAGRTLSVTPQFRALAVRLWDAWWDKTPPDGTPEQRRAAALARRHAKARDWPAAAALDEDQLDEPGYRPWSHYRPATGTGTAAPFTPDAPVRQARRIA